MLMDSDSSLKMVKSKSNSFKSRALRTATAGGGSGDREQLSKLVTNTGPNKNRSSLSVKEPPPHSLNKEL